MCIVGVDIAAKDFTAALLLPGQKPKLAPGTFSQDNAGFTRFTEVLKSTGYRTEQILIVMEVTGPYWVALALTLTQSGYATSVVNPAQVHYPSCAQLKRAKNDQLDALTVAQFAQTLLPKIWQPPPQFYYELRQRLTQRDHLLKLLGQVNNQLHALSVSPVVIESVQLQLQGLQLSLSDQIKQMEAEIQLIQFDRHAALAPAAEAEIEPVQLTNEQEWQRSIALLRTIGGIGVLSACWLVVATLNFTTCDSPEALVHYAGLAPKNVPAVVRCAGVRKSGIAVTGGCVPYCF
jgi:transposase